MSDLPKLLHYSSWANEAWIRFVSASCPNDEYLVTRLSHILHGERAWLQRVAGEEPDRDIWSPMTIPRLLEVHGDHRKAIAGLLGEDLGRIVSYRRFTGEVYQSPVRDILLHLVSHGGHHRGQMATHASGLGLRPINTDFIQFLSDPRDLRSAYRARPSGEATQRRHEPAPKRAVVFGRGR